MRAFLDPPLYSRGFERGFGTLYTAVYRPGELVVGLSLAGRDLAAVVRRVRRGASTQCRSSPILRRHERQPRRSGRRDRLRAGGRRHRVRPRASPAGRRRRHRPRRPAGLVGRRRLRGHRVAARRPAPPRSTGSPRSPRPSRRPRSCSCATRAVCTWTIPPSRYLPELRRAESPFGAIETVTLRRMLSPRVGADGRPARHRLDRPLYQGDPAANLARAAELGTSVPPNTQQKYSNLAYQLLGEVVTRVSGVPYAEYLRANVLDPLRPVRHRRSSRSPPASPRGGRPGTPPGVQRRPDVARSIGAKLPAEGGLWSCVEDLARWISFQLREDGATARGAQVLAGTTLAEMHRRATWATRRGPRRGRSAGTRSARTT